VYVEIDVGWGVETGFSNEFKNIWDYFIEQFWADLSLVK